MSTALLLAEPEPDTRGFLERHLKSDGFQVVDGEVRPDLVLLGDSAALDECRARHGDVPVIVLGQPESDAVDRVRALERGCDDFLVRPFAYEELLARIRAVLRRTAPTPHEGRRDPARDRRRAFGRAGGQRVRAAAETDDRSDARLHEGAAPARCGASG